MVENQGVGIRNNTIDKYHAVIGRALIFASNFESNCKSLCFLIGRRIRGSFSFATVELNTNKDTAKFVEAIKKLRLSAQITKASKALGLTASLHEAFETGRIARNFIAHELTIGLDRTLGSAEARATMLATIGPHVEAIATAHIIAGMFILVLAGEALPSLDEFHKNRKDAVKWVLDI